jgi:transcriptional regulator with XRE-family HTH domain
MKTMAQNTTFQHGRLGKLREAKEITQQELTDAIRPYVKKISRELIKDFEIGSRIPRIDVVVAFAKYFKVSTDYLFGLTETPTPDTDIRMISDYTGLSEAVIERFHQKVAFQQYETAWDTPDATNEILDALLEFPSFCISLGIPILQKARRIVASDIAKQIFENPQKFKATSKKGEGILAEIIQQMDSLVSKIPLESVAQYKEIEDKLILNNITEILERYLSVQDSADFDRFQASQMYIKAYDKVMEKDPTDHIIAQQNDLLFSRTGINYIDSEGEDGK